MWQQQHIGQCRIRHIQVDRVAHCHAAATFGNLAQPAACHMTFGQCRQHAHRHIGRIGQRIWQRVIAHLLQQQSPVDISQAHATVGLGH